MSATKLHTHTKQQARLQFYISAGSLEEENALLTTEGQKAIRYTARDVIALTDW
jgi:hypothetical protein